MTHESGAKGASEVASDKGEQNAQRVIREAAFHDAAFKRGAQQRLPRYYRLTAASTARYQQLVRRHASGTQALEFGCGVGSMAYQIASLGGSVVGIDISNVAIDIATKTAAEQGVSARVRFERMNAERLEFPDASFDLVCGSGILHHLSLPHAYSEIARVLKPGGRAVFFEPLGHNPLINLYRRLTPSLRTEDEHPLLRKDIELARESFDVRDEYYHLFSIGLAFCPSWLAKLYRPIAVILDRIALNEWSPFRSYAWIVVLQFAKKSSPNTSLSSASS